MTIIAYRDGVMAADGVMWRGNVCLPAPPKIKRLADGTLFAASGTSAICQWFLDAFPNLRAPGGPAVAADDLSALIVCPDGSCLKCDFHLLPYTVLGPYHAVGASFEFVSGALAAGASAEQAVRLAIEHTDLCGGEVQVERWVPARKAAA